MKKTHYILIACVVSLSSCYYDNFQKLNPENVVTTSGCDTTTTISYINHIKPILDNYCTQCHNSSGSAHDLSTHATSSADALSGKLYNSVAQNGLAMDMPQGGSKLSNCDITKIKKWAAAGAPNN